MLYKPFFHFNIFVVKCHLWHLFIKSQKSLFQCLPAVCHNNGCKLQLRSQHGHLSSWGSSTNISTNILFSVYFGVVVLVWPCFPLAVGCLLWTIHTQQLLLLFLLFQHMYLRNWFQYSTPLCLTVNSLLRIIFSEWYSIKASVCSQKHWMILRISSEYDSLHFSYLNVSNTLYSVLLMTWILNSIFLLLSLQVRSVGG